MSEQIRNSLQSYKRLVIKIGSALITGDGRGLDNAAIDSWATDIAYLHQQNIEVALVSSGAVAEGMARLGLSKRPDTLHAQQAAAAVGQMGLAQAWQRAFDNHGVTTAQVLLTHEDLSERQRYLNARNTLNTLFKVGVVPVINENDTVATEEIRFGDNDALAAMVANLLEAQGLIILTDQAGVFDADPRNNAQAKLISSARADDDYLLQVAGAGGVLGRGGMSSKVAAARLAARSGAHTLIASGREPQVIRQLLAGANIGSLLEAQSAPLGARKQWLVQQKTRGILRVDAGAAAALRAHKSLLPVGLLAVEGEFVRGDSVDIYAADGLLIGRALVNYSSGECASIRGSHSDELAALLGYAGDAELCHADNIALA